MLSVEQSYSRLFRPWDISEDKQVNGLKTTVWDKTVTAINDIRTNKIKLDEKRENRLRKIRGQYKKNEPNTHQDATVSTTTDNELNNEEKSFPTSSCNVNLKKESPVASLTSYCDRLLSEPDTPPIKTQKKPAESKNIPTRTENIIHSPLAPPNLLPPSNLYNSIHPSFIPEYVPDLAQALGVPPTDPLLLESLAQGYAMELEYARILQQENEAKLMNARKQRPKKYKCPHCNVGFSNNGQLKGHVRIHTGERPYKCDEKNCGKSFTRNEELTRHKRIHSGVRPYPCSTCGKKFGRRDHLKKHTRTHFLQAERMMPVFVPLSAVPHGFPYLYGY